jgi:hypothetical protein
LRPFALAPVTERTRSYPTCRLGGHHLSFHTVENFNIKIKNRTLNNEVKSYHTWNEVEVFHTWSRLDPRSTIDVLVRFSNVIRLQKVPSVRLDYGQSHEAK